MEKLDPNRIENIIALTSLQEGMLFHYLQVPQSQLYFEQLSLEISGEIDVPHFEKAWQVIIETNEMLRTVFRWEKVENPVQIVLKEHKFQPRYIHIAGQDAGERKERLEKIKRKDEQEKFDLQEVPFRVTLGKIEVDKYVMIISNHHILYDGWSTGIILKEFFKIYHELSRSGQALEFPVKLSFKEFVKWTQNQDKNKQENFWRNYLAGFETPTELPVKKRIEKASSTHDYMLILPGNLKNKLDDFIRNNRVTLAAVMYSAWGTLLQIYCDSADVVFGTAVSGRPGDLKGIEDMVGLFINTVPLRFHVPVHKKLGEIIFQTDQILRNREEFENTPLVNIFSYSPVTGGESLFDTIIAVESYPLDNRLIPAGCSLAIQSYAMVEMTHYDLSIGIMPFHGIEIKFSFKEGIFPKETITHLAGHFKSIIQTMIECPETMLSQLEIISDEEKNRILYDFNNTAAEYPTGKTIHQLFAEKASQTPEHIAVVGAGSQTCPVWITYHQLDKQSGRLAGSLIAKGILPGDMVGIMMNRSVELIVAIMGILKSGGAYLPIDPGYPQERVDYILKDSNAAILLTDEKETNFQLLTGRPQRLHHSDLAYVIYTSGSTGRPKGVMIDHQPVVNLLFALQNHYPFTMSDSYLFKTSYTFDVSVTELFGWYMGGGKMVILEVGGEKDPRVILNWVQRYWVTHINFVPSMFNAFLEYLAGENKQWLAGLKYIFLAGEALLPGLVTKFTDLNTGIALENLYGPTEGTVYSSRYSLSGWNEIDNIPIGKPLHNIKLYILDKYHHLQPPGIVGELIIAGLSVARGYLNRPGLTAEKFGLQTTLMKNKINKSFSGVQGAVFQKSPLVFYKTGDLARWLSDGNIEFLGRVDQQVKIRGFRIELGEIENELAKHKDIKESVVVTVESENGSKHLCAYLVCRAKIELSELREFLANQLPNYMIPSYFVNLEKIPLTASGKVDRKALPDPGGMSLEDNLEYLPPQNAIEKILVETWTKVLGRNNIGIHENFFRIGGDSIKAIQVISRMSRAGYKLEMKDLFQYPVLSDLAPRVTKLKRIPRQAIITGTIPLSPIQKMFFQQSHFAPHHYNQSVMLHSRERLAKEAIEAVFSKIQEHHDVLRVLYQGDESTGAVIQVNQSLDYPFHLEEHDLRNFKNWSEELKTKINVIQASIDLEKGPLMKLGLFHLNDRDCLLIVFHHLVIDGVSWRILFEDIETLYNQYKGGEPLRLPAKTDSFKLWSEKLSIYANSNVFLKEKKYWQKIESFEAPLIDTDFAANDNDNYHKDTVNVSFTLGMNETEDFLTKVNKALGTENNDILLTALGISIKETFGQDRVLIALEGHGREEILEDIDLSRTVGWFTSVYPVVIDMHYAADPGRQVKEVKETLRRIPNKGIGYGILKYLTAENNKKEIAFKLKPQISFNYMGQFDADAAQISSFKVSKDSTGDWWSLNNQREYLLDVVGITVNNRLTITISYNEKHFQPGTIATLAGNFETGLRRLIAFCCAQENVERTPSDFTYKGFAIEQIDRLMKKYPGLDDIYTLTPMQEGMLFHALAGETSHAYFEQISYRIRCTQGELNITWVEKSLNELFKRHDILRTSFVYEDSEFPVQIVLQERTVDFYYKDISQMGEGIEKENFIKEFKKRDKDRSFDLSNGTLMRAAILRLDNNEYEFVWSFHHIIMDGWCLGIINREFFEIYDGYLENRPYRLPKVKPYRTYIQWLEKHDKDESALYWQNYLNSYEEQAGIRILQAKIPAAKVEKEKTPYRDESVSILFEPGKTAALNSMAALNHVTLNTLTQTLWGILLGKYNRKNDVVFGAVVSGRAPGLAGIESMVGLFINTIPVRIRFESGLKLNTLLHEIQENALASEPHHYHPLAEIQSRSLLKQELIDHLFIFENYPIKEQLEIYENEKNQNSRLSLKLTNVCVFEQTNYDFNIILQGTDRLRIIFQYNGSVYDKDFVEGISRHFCVAIDQVIENRELKVGELTFLSEEEKNRVLYEFNDTAVDYPKDKTVQQLFEEQAERTPDHVALVGAGPRVCPVNLSYRHLNGQSDQVAGLLIEKGVLPDTLVGIMMNRSVELIVAIMGILKSGGAYLPIDPEYPQERIDYMLKDSNTKILINKFEIRNSKFEFRASNFNASNLAYLIYTSGSTGKPKGVVIENRSVINFIKGITDVIPFGENDRILSLTTICFDIFGLETLLPLTRGSAVIMGSEAQQDVFLGLRIIEREAITIFQATPSRLQLFIQDKAAGKALMKLKYLIIGGEALPGPLLESFKQHTAARIFNVYGPTETTIWSTIKEVSGDLALNIGKPLANTYIYILSYFGTLQPVRVPGECCIGGDGVARGYLNKPELTAEKFRMLMKNKINKSFSGGVGGRFYKKAPLLYYTGDLACWLPDGNIEFLGRIDKQVKIRGFRVELGEIETQLLKHDHVKAAVAAVTNGDTINAYIVLENEELKKAPAASQFKEFLSQYLPGYMIPSHFFLLEKIPLTSNGKIDIKALQAANTLLGSGVEYISPQSDIERIIAQAWKNLLGLEKVGVHDNFFDLGGNSLSIIRLTNRLKEALPGHKDISVVSLFNHPTIASLANYLNREEPKTSHNQSHLKNSAAAIAVIGMAGRFPGAKDIDEFWHNIKNGIESIRFFTNEELKELGVAHELIKNPDYVPAKGILDNKEYFDSFFFGYTPVEAGILDPQVRIFHECTWAALENAGYNPFNYDGAIGLYAGASPNSLWEISPLTASPGSYSEMWNALQFSDKDYLSTRIAYKLDLKGPCITIQTACSTSLVAVDQACRALVSGACNIALAGGVSITFLDDAGYLYQEGTIMSPDGHCRAFDAQAKGTVGGNGAGVVVLKCLSDAETDGDTIYAVIKGFGINNDGKNKVGFTAPSSRGQAKAIRDALAVAAINPETISYIETHGTGTHLGDPIEIEGLKLAFNSAKRHFCALGSVKTNIGHLDAAAGIAGFIKTTLSLYHRSIPPSLNFQSPNPQCDLENSPFYVNTQLKPCENHPFRAGISSFGLGGTNVHIILEEYASGGQEPFCKKVPGPPKTFDRVILLSAKTPAALETMSQNLANYFEQYPHINLADAAYTLQVGRNAFNYRKMLVCSDLNEAIAKLPDAETGLAREEKHTVIFMFSGQGSQYVNMGLDLYQNVPVFQNHIDECFTILEKITGSDMKPILYPKNQEQKTGAEEKIFQFKYTTPIKFSFEYSLAKTLMAWGITPNAMIGHSFGEYVAACLSGVFSLQDGIFLAALRGQLMHGLPDGAMLSVPLSETELKQRLAPENELDIAAINTASLCIISGPIAAVNRFETQLNQEGHECLRLQVPKAGHSHMVEPIMAEFKQKIRKVTFNKPQIPFISCVTGTWMKAEDAVNPDYWTGHLRKPVRFADGLTYLFKEPNPVFLQTTPGKGLILFINQHPDHKENTLTLSMVRHHKEPGPDVRHTLTQFGRLWLHGCDKMNWQIFHEEKRKRIPLPSYSFESTHYPINKELFKPGALSISSSFSKEIARKKTNDTEWFYIPSWERSTLPPSLPTVQKQTILVFSDERIGPQLIQQLEQNGANVITVQMGTLNPAAKESYDELWQNLETQGQIPSQIYHLWSISPGHNDKTLPDNIDKINENLTHGFYSLLYLVQAIAKQNSTKDREICLNIITAGACEVTGNEELNPAGASIHALARVIRQEYTDLTCRCIDISFPIPPIAILLEEFSANSLEPTVAYRGDYRWVESFKPLRLQKPQRENVPLKEKGVYLITGGLGTIGMTLAEYLAVTYHARLILTGRSHVPPEKKQRLLAMEAAGAEILVLKANAADHQQMQDVFQQAEERFGQINGIIHAAGNVGEKFLSPLKDMGKPETQWHFEAKIYGLLTLAGLLKNKPMDFCLLLSSTSAILGGLGFGAYAAANRFMDAYIYYLNRNSRNSRNSRTHWICLNYDSWQSEEAKITGKVLSVEIKELAITPGEGVEIFERVLSWPRAKHVIGCTGDLQPRIDRWVKLQGLHTPDTPDREMTPGTQEEKIVPVARRPRPHLATPYILPQSPREKETAAIWEELLGYEPIGLQDNFFELNGDSLKAVIAISKIHRKTGVKVPLKDFFSNPTIAGIVQYSEGAKGVTFYTIEPVEKKEYYPLSSAQKRLYIFQLRQPDSTAYNIPTLHRLTGNFDIEKFREIFITLIQRHEALRTAFLTVNGEIVQTIAASSDFTMTYWELDEAGALSKILTLFKPFDLGRAPLLRVGLIKVQEQDYIIFIDIHHIISDRGSMDILIDNIFRLYQGENLTPLHIQYKDYVARLDKQLKDEAMAAREKYWLNRLQGLAFTKLPMDYLKPQDRVIGRALNQEIESSLYRQIDHFCIKHNVTKFIFLITALQITLARELDQWDIALGIPSSSRDHQDLKEAIGIFLNVLVIRTAIDYNETFLNQLTKSKNIVTGALDNQDYPYESLIDKIKAKDNHTAPNELFSILFNYFQVDQDQKNNFPGFQIHPMEMPEISPKYDMTFYGYEGVNRLKISIVYKSNIYSEDTIKKLAADFLATIQNALENEKMSIAQLTNWNRCINDDGDDGSDIDQYYN